MDDFAFRKVQRYGTFLVNLGRYKIIGLFSDQEVATLQAWLQKHPEVEVINRDRALVYTEAATNGAPQLQQVSPGGLNETTLCAAGLGPVEGLTPRPKIILRKTQIEQRESEPQQRLACYGYIKQCAQAGTPLA